jgi:D-alanyl-D-alanine carboxypeptidase
MKDNLKAPIKKGTEVGEFVVFQKGIEIGRFPLVADQSLRKATIRERISRWFKGMIPG